MPNIRYTIYLPEEMLKELEDLKAEKGIPVSESIRRGILLYLASQK